ncbi:MAG: hypothetical protein ACRDRX_08820 [Pseudonocardiaceae bacterium]
MTNDLTDLFPKVKNGAERLADKWSRVFPWVYWPSAAFCGLLMIAGIPLVGVVAVTAPALLYWRTRKVGLDRVSPLIYYAPFLPLATIAFFAGLYYLSKPNQDVTPWIIVGAVVFIISTYGFATMLEHAHKTYLAKEQPTDYTATSEVFAEYRILQFRLVAATTVLFATQSPILIVCLLALVKRGRATAIVAGIAAGAAAVLSFKGHWIIDLTQLYVGYKAVRLWLTAAYNPIWPTSAKFAVRLASGAGRTFWRTFIRP